MKVHKLYVNFVKGVREIQIYAKKGLNEIAGPNESGKTSLLDAIKWAFGGKKLMDDKPVRTGKYEGSIILETDDGFTIRQRILGDGRVSVSVKDKDGGIHGRSRLKQSFNKLSFDPLSFSNMKPAERIHLVESFAGKDFIDKRKDLQIQIENVFESRRIDKRLLLELGETEPVKKAERINVDEIIAEGEKIDRYNEGVQKHVQELQGIRDSLRISRANESKAEEEIQRIQLDLEKVQSRLDTFKTEGRHLEKLLEDIGPAPLPMSKDDVNKRLAESIEINSAVFRYEAYVEKMRRSEELRSKIKTATETLEYLKEVLSDHVSSIKLPIDGLTFDGKEIAVNGIPWGQLSMSQKIQYSAYIGMALNEELKIMFVYDGSLLDDERLKILTDIVEEKDYQLWIETVGEGRTEDAIILEAGTVKGAKDKKGSLDDKEVQ